MSKNLRALAAIQKGLKAVKADLKADFMEKQVFEADGLEVETKEGTFFLPETSEDDLANMFGTDDIIEVKAIHGWFGRYSAPGYLDATDYVFNVDKDACEEELESLYGNDEADAIEGAKDMKKTTVKADAPQDFSEAIEELAEAKTAADGAEKAAVANDAPEAKAEAAVAKTEAEKAVTNLEEGVEKLSPVASKKKIGAKKTIKAGEFPNFEKKDKKDDKAEDKKEEKSEKKDDEPKKEKKSPKAGEIEIVKDGEVIEVFPDAFGDDSVSVIKFFRKLYAITDKDDKAAVKKVEKGEKKEEKGEKKEEKAEDIEKMPKALPKVEAPKEEKKDKAEAPAPNPFGAASQTFVKVSTAEQKEMDGIRAFFEKRVKLVREITAVLVEKNHVCAEQSDIDANLLQGKDLETSVDEALKLSADRKFKELQAQTDADLLSLKASLPNLKPRSAKVDITASKEIEGGLSLMELSILATVNHEGKRDAQFSLGAAFGAGLF